MSYAYRHNSRPFRFSYRHPLAFCFLLADSGGACAFRCAPPRHRTYLGARADCAVIVVRGWQGGERAFVDFV
ncbi:hypothetical protein C8Q79DRAFT_239174 [Trametes meyenii]|nr:hypothetical protein C8Q79DRAFT_239174 [Trametes meyenii]